MRKIINFVRQSVRTDGFKFGMLCVFIFAVFFWEPFYNVLSKLTELKMKVFRKRNSDDSVVGKLAGDKAFIDSPIQDTEVPAQFTGYMKSCYTDYVRNSFEKSVKKSRLEDFLRADSALSEDFRALQNGIFGYIEYVGSALVDKNAETAFLSTKASEHAKWCANYVQGASAWTNCCNYICNVLWSKSPADVKLLSKSTSALVAYKESVSSGDRRGFNDAMREYLYQDLILINDIYNKKYNVRLF